MRSVRPSSPQPVKRPTAAATIPNEQSAKPTTPAALYAFANGVKGPAPWASKPTFSTAPPPAPATACVVVLNRVKTTRGGQILEQQQVVVIHPQGGKAGEVWLHFSDKQAMDEFASS